MRKATSHVDGLVERGPTFACLGGTGNHDARRGRTRLRVDHDDAYVLGDPLGGGARRIDDTRDGSRDMAYHNWWGENQISLQQALAKCNVDYVSISTDEDYVKSLMRLFRLRN